MRIVCCEARLERFCHQDAYWPYDHLGQQDAQANPNTITQAQIRYVNTAMLARTPCGSWVPFLGSPLPQLASVPTDIDLIQAGNGQYDAARAAVLALYLKVTGMKGITDMAASKVLYLHRPRLIAISDSYVRQCLRVAGPWPSTGRCAYAARGVATLAAVRHWGQVNLSVLSHLANFAASLTYRGHSSLIPLDTPVNLSLARILDIYLWTEQAIANGHPGWAPWHAGHKPQCPQTVVLTLPG